MKLGPTLENLHGNILGSHIVFRTRPQPLIKVHDDPIRLEGQILQIMGWDSKKWRNLLKVPASEALIAPALGLFLTSYPKLRNKLSLRLQTSHTLTTTNFIICLSF